MGNKTDSSLVLLTYKGKVLLKLHNSNPEIYDNPINTTANSWSFLNASKSKHKSLKEGIIAKALNETGIVLQNVTDLVCIELDDRKHEFFHAYLTDDNVNNMQRREGQTLQFFTIKELNKLNLTQLSRLFVDNHKEILENLK